MVVNNEFEKIWTDTVEQLIIEFSELLGVKHKPLSWLKFILRYHYTRQKKYVKKAYMKKNTINIDRHKVSACIMKSILTAKPLFIPLCKKIKFLCSSASSLHSIIDSEIKTICNEDKLQDIEKYYIYLNEYLAVSVAVSILDGYIMSDEDEDRFKHHIVMPEPFPKPDEDYLLDVCIGLYYSGVKGFNPITYANVLFLWEKYSCRKTQCDNIIASYTSTLYNQGMSTEEIENFLNNARLGKDQRS